MTANPQLQRLIKNIQCGLETYSVQELNSIILKGIQGKTKSQKSEEVNFILESICVFYGISKRTLLNGNIRGNFYQARQISMCLLHTNLGISQRHIALVIFKKSNKIVNDALKKIRLLDLSNKWDKEFKERYDYFNQKLNDYIINKG